jgi:hypothetical protein
MRALIPPLLAASLLVAARAHGQRDRAAAWRITIGAQLGAPTGWVRVRENTIAGTRLDLGHDLRITRLPALELHIARHPERRTGWELTVTGYRLAGTTRLQRDVLFNGSTLASGTTLHTRTDFSRFLRIDLAARRQLLALGPGGNLSATVGLTAVLLTVELRGTLARATVGHETREDFVTQELPVPIVGLTARLPLGRRFAARTIVSGGYLPWVNSLRREGGEVQLTQTHADIELGAEYTLTPTIDVTGAYRTTSFTQRERSREDGNDIHLRGTLLRLGVARRW